MRAHLRLVENDNDGTSPLRKLYNQLDEIQSDLAIASVEFEASDIEVHELHEHLNHLDEVINVIKATILQAAFHHNDLSWTKDS